MPSPVGHALGGFAFGWLAASSIRLDRPALAAVVFAGLGVVPDLDILVEETHRLYTHSFAAVALVLVLAAAALQATGSRVPARSRRMLILACAAAYGSHLLLDWLGDDRSLPYGIRAFWPISDAHFQSDLRWFPQVERQYWLPRFLTTNLRAVGWELLLLSPVVALALWVRHRAGASAQAYR
jgi:membrane-bound metal-dependent hydrolase YbcI (DUF457 family)